MKNDYLTDEEKETRIADRIAMALMLAIALLALLTSCTRRIYVPVESSVKDSVAIHHIDSTVTHTRLEIKDSVRVRDSIVLVLDDQGNVKQKESWHEKNTVSKTVDSTAYFKDLVARLLKQENTVKVKLVEVEKPLTRWQQSLMYMGWAFMVTLAIGLLSLAAYIIYKVKRKTMKR